MGASTAPTFWWGIGPGNFASPYLKYKLPTSSEEILDPHNIFLEVWATGGFLALVALVAALVLGVWNLFGPCSPAGTSTSLAAPIRSQKAGMQRRDKRGGSSLVEADEEEGAPPRGVGWLVAAAGTGWLLVVILRRLNPFDGYRWLVLGPFWLAAVLFGAPLWRRLGVPAAAVGAAVVAIAINLFAAGGIGIPTVALGLWSFLALGLNLREDRSCGRLREYPSRMPAFVLLIGWAALLGTFAGVVGPFWRSEAAIEAADTAISRRPPDIKSAEEAYLTAIEADRYNARPWLKLAQLYWLAWQERGATVEDPRWRRIPILYQKAASPPRNPAAWTLHVDRARVISQLLSAVGTQISPIEALRYRGEIVEATRTAARFHPTNAELHARLAEASAEISMYQDAVTEATEALRLDAIMPHRDRKLPGDVRRRLEAMIPKWSESAAQMPIRTTP
jgi:hypothetical protein